MAMVDTIRARYYRKTQAEPEGAVAHHGDCLVFSASVCSCGLLHDLMPLGVVPAAELYPAYERDLEAQDRALQSMARGAR